jgi:hypothetical protein
MPRKVKANICIDCDLLEKLKKLAAKTDVRWLLCDAYEIREIRLSIAQLGQGKNRQLPDGCRLRIVLGNSINPQPSAAF